MSLRRPAILFVFIALFFGVVSIPVQAQQTSASVTASDATAIQIAEQFVLQNSGTVVLASYSATGTVSRYLGDTEESAPVTLQSMGFHQARLDSQFSSGTKSEVRGVDAQSTPTGQWTNEPGSHAVLFDNLYQGTNWFFPLLSSLGQFADSSLTFKLIGPETWNEVAALHVQVLQTISPATKKFPAVVIATNYYLDPQTYLLRGMAGTLRPDNGSPAEIAWEVRYSLYSKFQGVMVPTQIEEYLNGTRIRSIAISNVQINPSLAASAFQAQ